MSIKNDGKNLGGRPSKFKPEFIQIAEEVLAQAGAGREELCAKIGITPNTLRNWMRSNSEFKESVEIGLNRGKALLLQQARNSVFSSKDFSYNTPLFIRILQTVYRDADEAAVYIEGWSEAKTTQDQVDLVNKLMAQGDLTVGQAEKIINILIKKAQLIEMTELKLRLEKLESAQ